MYQKKGANGLFWRQNWFMTSRYLQTHGSGAILTEQIQINTIIEISLGLRQLLASYLPGKLLLNFPDSTQMSPLPQAKLITSSFISHSTQKLHVLKKKRSPNFFHILILLKSDSLTISIKETSQLPGREVNGKVP